MPRWPLFLLLLCWLVPSRAAPDRAIDPPWQAALHFSPGTLSMWQLQLDATPEPDSKVLDQHLTLRLQGSELAGSALQARLPGRWSLSHGSHRLQFKALQLRLDLAGNAVLLLDDRERPWATAEMPHRHDDGTRLDWRWMNLRVLPAAAKRLGVPALADQLIGGMDLLGPPIRSGKGSTSCRPNLLWPSPAAPADIALSNIPSVSARRCEGCSASGQAGRVVIAPDAELVNVGQSDVPWLQKFSPPGAPYNNDQHPFLVWAMYRIDADGGVVPLGVSGVKHAFFAQNDMCSCAGDQVLYRGCSDLYAALTNDISSFLGPREEIAPRAGLWGRCGSVFDPNCDGVQDSSGAAADGYQRRLVVAEADLLPTLHPGARWWIEAWYVVRDDSGLDNSFAHREVVPTRSNGAWTFPISGAVRSGPLINRWVDPAALNSGEASQRLALESGRLQLSVRVEALSQNRFRYRYALMNLDFARADISGSEPGLLRIENNRGVQGLRLNGAQCGLAAVANPRASEASSDWTLDGDGRDLVLRSRDNRGLGWGQLAVFEFESALPPQTGTVAVLLPDAGVAEFTLLAPEDGSCRLRAGFESAQPLP